MRRSEKGLAHGGISKIFFACYLDILKNHLEHKIKPKPSLDGTLSSNTISFSEGLYCTVLVIKLFIHEIVKVSYFGMYFGISNISKKNE